MSWKKIQQKNYTPVFFVSAAFTLMVVIGGFSTSNVIKKSSLSTVDVSLRETEKTIRAYLHEPKIAFDNIYVALQEILDKNESQDYVRQYLTHTMDLLMHQNDGVQGITTVYGYIRNEFIKGPGVGLDGDFIPQQQLWYQLAVRTEGTGYTAPYTDVNTGSTIISLSREIYGINGDYYGVLALDIDISWLMEYTESLQFVEGGYGMILNQYLYIIAHPQKQYINTHLQELGNDYAAISNTLYTEQNVTAARIRNTNDEKAIVFFRQLYNGWFVGVVMPSSSYFSDLYLSVLILASLGVVLALILSYILLRLSAAKIDSDKKSRSKSTFIAHMSHEIRTPMNAITGMAELALREDLSDTVREYVLTIKQAGANLLSIINDALDLSKIESGKLEIVSGEYLFSSLINDVISIIRMQVIDSQILFAVNIDRHIPNMLYGDEIRIRQSLLNILSNAVKYTEKGYVSVTISGEVTDGDIINLTIEVADSGRGIKQEDVERLFGDYTQFDLAYNKGIEGTGLGLAITRNLIKAMGGDISVSSQYGHGSTFTITLPQEIRSHEIMAAVENPEDKRALVYELRDIYANSIVRAIDSLGVACTLVLDDSEFCKEIASGSYTFVFIAAPLYKNVREACREFESGSKIILLAGFGETVAERNLNILAMPVHSISIANIMNGVADSFLFYESGESVIRFTAPNADILIVDDVPTNLNVAAGLLLPYKMRVNLCQSGLEAIAAVTETRYDLVFMDHMMPEMDGIEATKQIRALDGPHYKNMPIVALTANAISNIWELFKENGFDDFLSKPIDIIKLNAILEKWIPKEKQNKITAESGTNKETPEPVGGEIEIEGLDTKKGIKMLGGRVEIYMRVLDIFLRDGAKKAEEIQTCFETDNLPLYITYVHALKSVSASIGADMLSEMAKALEIAGIQEDLAFIQAHNANLLSTLETLLTNIKIVIDRRRPTLPPA